MSRRERLFWLCAGGALIVLVFSLIPSHYEICKEAKEAQQENCAPYQVVPFVGIKVIQLLDKLGAVITALATIAITIFTFTLKRATDKLWTAGENQLRHAQAEAEAADFHRTAQFEQISAQIEALEQSARAAEENVSVTRQLVWNAETTAQRQLRAYVHVKGAIVKNINKPTERVVVVEIENFGQTPAKEVVFRVGEHVREWPLASVLADPPEDLRKGVGPLAPRGVSFIPTPVSPLSAWEEGELQAGRAAIYAWGDINYLDCFDQPQRAWFCMVCEGEGLPTGSMHLTQEGNGAT